ncbi:MAG: trypsin-like peptidase domain-containing protein [bacterium]
MTDGQNKSLISFLIIVSFLSGIVGGVGGMALLATSTSLQKSLGITSSDGAITFPTSEKVESISVKEDSAVISSVKKVSSSVVSVVFTKDVQVFDPFAFGAGEVQQQQGGGSGFIITSDGLVATNKHVANIEGASYTVITQDGKKYDAKVKAIDPINDFAILKIDASNLPTVEFGNSDDLEIGQRVIAIGNALGEFQNTVTTGIISGKERSITASDGSGAGENLYGLLQTDAAINEGNSGGPLVNLKGQVIGMNTATASKGQAEGLGFALPINSLRLAIDSIKKNGKIVRPYIGVVTVAVDQKIAAVKGLKDAKGALVYGDPTRGIAAVISDSPAEKAGIKQGDVILKVNNEEINENKSLPSILSKYSPGDEINILIMRDNNQTTIKLKLGEVSS